jgi:hypothetical protein
VIAKVVVNPTTINYDHNHDGPQENSQVVTKLKYRLLEKLYVILIELCYLPVLKGNNSYSNAFNPVHGEVYWIQHYVIKFVSNMRQVNGFLRVF